ncbi:putative nucleotidyltransferase, ribonuclease H [Tanacetum coccineum]
MAEINDSNRSYKLFGACGNEEREKTFEELKRRLVSSPVLILCSGTGGFQIYSDASKKGLGCVLMQHGKVIAYASRFGGIICMEKLVTSSPITKAEIKEAHNEDGELWSVLENLKEVDRLTKSAYFLPIQQGYSVSKLAKIFQQETIRLHGTPTSIVSDRDPCFTSQFWKGLQNAWGMRLKFSIAFHPQIDGQTEQTIKSLKDIRPKLVEVAKNKKVTIAKENLKEARSRQKSYADRYRIDSEFQPEDHVFLKLSPYRVGEVSYRLALSLQLSHVHNVFHISLLRGYNYHLLHVISTRVLGESPECGKETIEATKASPVYLNGRMNGPFDKREDGGKIELASLKGRWVESIRRGMVLRLYSMPYRAVKAWNTRRHIFNCQIAQSNYPLFDAPAWWNFRI